MYKIPKVIVSCRIHPDLKEELEEEAIMEESTMSNHVETIIRNRHQNDSENVGASTSPMLHPFQIRELSIIF